MGKAKRSKKDQIGLGDELFGTRLGETRGHSPKKSGSDLFIIDNSDEDWKVKRYLQEWADIAHSFDIDLPKVIGVA